MKCVESILSWGGPQVNERCLTIASFSGRLHMVRAMVRFGSMPEKEKEVVFHNDGKSGRAFVSTRKAAFFSKNEEIIALVEDMLRHSPLSPPLE